MSRFYEHLVEGENASESLHQAMKWMRKNGFTQVSQWASFTLIGDGVRFEFGAPRWDSVRKDISQINLNWVWRWLWFSGRWPSAGILLPWTSRLVQYISTHIYIYIFSFFFFGSFRRVTLDALWYKYRISKGLSANHIQMLAIYIFTCWAWYNCICFISTILVEFETNCCFFYFFTEKETPTE